MKLKSIYFFILIPKKIIDIGIYGTYDDVWNIL